MQHPPFEIIQTDVSKIRAGDWFFPMTIKEVNQHSLIADAFQKGAVGVTIQSGERAPAGYSFSEVPDLRQYLFRLAQLKRPLLSTKVAVVTGSNGKTTVKELLGSIIQVSHPKTHFISPANLNTKIALATQILRLPESCEVAGFEMGARRVGDFEIPLSYLQPSVVALLNIGSAHVGEFGSREKLCKEKLSGLFAPSAQILVVPSCSEMIMTEALKAHKQVITFGYSSHSSVRILESNADTVKLAVRGLEVSFHCPFMTCEKERNVAAAVAMALALEIPLDKIKQGLASFKGVSRRFQAFDWQGIPAIDDAFNASPESMATGLQEFAKIAKDKKSLLVLGSMLELGETSLHEHRKIADLILQTYSPTTNIAVVGEDAAVIASLLRERGFPQANLFVFSDSTSARTHLQPLRSQFQLAFFKGSKSIRLDRIFTAEACQ